MYSRSEAEVIGREVALAFTCVYHWRYVKLDRYVLGVVPFKLLLDLSVAQSLLRYPINISITGISTIERALSST